MQENSDFKSFYKKALVHNFPYMTSLKIQEIHSTVNFTQGSKQSSIVCTKLLF